MSGDYNPFFWPNIGGTGSTHEMRDNEGVPTPRLLGMKSVSRSAAWALAPERPKPQPRPAGFVRR